MRALLKYQSDLPVTPIEQIELNPKSRDDTPAVLRGLQSLYVDKDVREQVLEILSRRILPDVDRTKGRPGMTFWQIFVLGVVKFALNSDYDRLEDLANHHRALRQMLMISDASKKRFSVQTLVDNVSLLTKEALDEINQVVVATGHKELKHGAKDALRCRADSAVARTNVEWPTDVRLLCDALRSLVNELYGHCKALEMKGWRKARWWVKRLTTAYRRCRKARKNGFLDRVRQFLAVARQIITKALGTVKTLKEVTDKMAWYLEVSEKLVDQVDRRLLKKEEIEHEEKIFSIFEPHTQWVRKGKAGVLAELGIPVCVLEDQHQFILMHHIQHDGGDKAMIVGFIGEAMKRYPSLTSCSMDKGFYSAKNRDALDELLDLNVMPKPGYRNAKQRERESHPDFVKARLQHPAIESAINNLQQRGMGLIRTHGKEGFDRSVGLAVLSANIHRLGKVVRKKEVKRRAWHAARAKAT